MLSCLLFPFFIPFDTCFSSLVRVIYLSEVYAARHFDWTAILRISDNPILWIVTTPLGELTRTVVVSIVVVSIQEIRVL